MEREKKALTASRISIILTILFFVSITQVLNVQAWGGTTHRSVVENASYIFSSGSFFSTYIATIRTYSTKPDEWKSIDPYEANCRHWYHIDEPEGENEYYRGGLPNNWTLLGKGVLPWVLEDNFNLLVERLRARNWNLAAQLAGVVSHYIADASMPLHATSDYNPGGKHTAFESTVDNRLNEISIPRDNYVPEEIENVFAAIKTMLEESYSYTGYQPDKLSYWLAQGVTWNPTLRSITENRIRSAVQLTANVWYTAMIRAGLSIPAPSLLQPEDGAVLSTITLTWAAVPGVSSFDLQLATDNSFSTNVLTFKGLSSTSFTIENLPSYGNWYWRVRSGDNSTHVGLWSEPRRFIFGSEPEKAILKLITLYKVELDMLLYVENHMRVIVQFQTYTYEQEENYLVCEGSSPIATFFDNISHPSGLPVKRAVLLLADNSGNVLRTITNLTVSKSMLRDRYFAIMGEWSGSTQKDELRNEYFETLTQWAAAPTV